MAKTKPKVMSTISIRDLELQVNLGWRLKERSQGQPVLLDIDIQLPSAPKACVSDKLNDTICYAKLIEFMRRQIGHKKFSLIEHLGYELYKIIKTQAPKKSKVVLRLTKFPKINGLLGGVNFDYGDK